MMRKLRLDLGALHVECFEVDPRHAAMQGTVMAAQSGACQTHPVEFSCNETQTCPLTLESIAVNCPTSYCESPPGWTQYCPEEDDTGP